MYSLNIPVPRRVAYLASDLLPYPTLLDRAHSRYTFVCKRFEDVDLGRLREQLRRVSASQPAFEVHVTDARLSEESPCGVAPIVYLTVNNPGLLDLHRTLTDDFGTIEGVEGDGYVPHVTPARGGSVADAHVVASQLSDPIEWTIS